MTEPTGQRNPIWEKPMVRETPAAASVAVTTRFFTIVHQQHPARPQGRVGQFLSSAAMSEASTRFRRNGVPPVAHQSCWARPGLSAFAFANACRLGGTAFHRWWR
jgi:hypothetical protein